MSQSTGTWERLIGKVGLLAVVIVAFALTAAGTVAWAQTTIVVDTNADDTAISHCSLREGINSAIGASGTGTCATGSGPFTINFEPSLVGETIALTSTLPAITNGTTLTITGPTSLPSGVTIDGGNLVQIMQVVPTLFSNPSATVNLQNLTLTNGNSVGSPSEPGEPEPITAGLGGAIYNQGTLNVSNCTFSNNQANGFSVQDGNLGNRGLPAGDPENFAGGGAIYNLGSLTVTNSMFFANQATGGSFPAASAGGNSRSTNGEGGAIWNGGQAVITVTNSTFLSNNAVGAAALLDSLATGGGLGGAIYDFGSGAMATITGSTFSANQAVGGSLSVSPVPGLAGPGFGGAIYEQGLMMTLSKSTFMNNQAIGGNSTVSSLGGQALGGAIIFNEGAGGSPNVDLSNSTFSGNMANGGSDANNVRNQSAGGAIFVFNDLVFVTNCTFSGNESETSMSGAIDINGSGLEMKNSIVAGNTPSNCGKVVIISGLPSVPAANPLDLGYNISSDGTCGFARTGTANNGINVDPMLAPLGSNGGPTMTFALQPTSPAIDAIPAPDDPKSPDCTKHTTPSSPPCVNQCTDLGTGDPLMTDQRGFPRPDRGEVCCDIGAFEFQETFPGQPGTTNCNGNSASALDAQYGSIDKAATALCFPSVQALHDAIRAFCAGSN